MADFTLRVKNVKQDTLVADGSEFLDVEVEVMKGTKRAEIRHFAYPLDTSIDDIDKDLSKFLITYTGEQEAAVEDKKRQEVQDAAQETITSLSGLEIDHDHATAKAAGKARKKG